MTDEIPENLSELLSQSQTSELEQLANEQRELIAFKLEQVARDIRNLRDSPYAAVVMLLTPTGPQLVRMQGLKLSMIEDAAHALSSLTWQHRRLVSGEQTIEQVLAEAHEHRTRIKATLENNRAAKLVAKPFKCDWCEFRAASTRGKAQHMRWQQSHGCLSCNKPRCSVRGYYTDYSNHYRGEMTCNDCVKAAKESNNSEISPTTSDDGHG